MTGRGWETAHMPNGGMYAPPAGHPRSQADRSADDAVIARRSQTSQDDVCATPGNWRKKTAKKEKRRASPFRDSALSGWRLRRWGSELGTACPVRPSAHGPLLQISTEQFEYCQRCQPSISN